MERHSVYSEKYVYSFFDTSNFRPNLRANLVRASYGFQRYLRDWIVSPCKLFQFVHRLKKKKKGKTLPDPVQVFVEHLEAFTSRVSHGVTVLFGNRCRDTASSTGSLLVILEGIWVRHLGSLNNHFEELIRRLATILDSSTKFPLPSPDHSPPPRRFRIIVVQGKLSFRSQWDLNRE